MLGTQMKLAAYHPGQARQFSEKAVARPARRKPARSAKASANLDQMLLEALASGAA